MLIKHLVLITVMVVVTGCVSSKLPKEAFKLSPTSLEDKHMQTRQFVSVQRDDLLLASAGVLQDLGYALDESNSKLGVLSASKMIDATDAGQVLGSILVAILIGSSAPVDDKQKIRVCLVVHQGLGDSQSSLARITIQRIVWNTQGKISKAQSVKEPELYTAFFEKLSKAVFLEANSI
ncbi:hypothetical protein [Thalassotalea sp. ND16A]|uniref:hypothetical protein n=1 Tax=Thalassotalea sp. ND16A TaxID=1535422 RepID=UPI00051D631F|nr:hypothetical protein [Thalassotalea sp. ND16A]KGK01534.1 hypothetical protein ND16A_2988 [Thalassotalea sp. ND16A]